MLRPCGFPCNGNIRGLLRLYLMILTRHILRTHIGPFLFSNAIIIFLFLLQFLMKRAGDLVGKGLSVWLILELIALNLSWILVLSVPMSVLVATLMAFGKLAAENETTIMRACGMSLYRMMAPVVLAAALLTVGLTWFNNAVLPESNIRLQTLMTDIVRIKPTMSIQAGVFTSEQDLPNYRILVRRTFEKSNDLEGVTIYDMSDPDRNVLVTAVRGTVSFSPDYTSVIMDLQDGEIHEVDNSTLMRYRMLRFLRHRVSIPASGFGFQRSDASTMRRDDRTMSAAMMQALVDSIALLQEEKQQRLTERMDSHVRAYLRGTPRYYSAAPMRFRDLYPHDEEAPPAATAGVQDSVAAAWRALNDARQLQAEALADASGISFDERQMDRYLVEIYKKYSIPVACLVFVLIGIPLGTMARRGGFGVGAGLSLGFFLFYWACLISGEKLADRGELSPFWGMWIANVLLGIMGALLTIRAARESTVIDWSVFTRFVPKMLRGEEVDGSSVKGAV
jgi:lipopolysaccharide export system permease protein